MMDSGAYYCPICREHIPNDLITDHQFSHELRGDVAPVEDTGPDGWAISMAGFIVAMGIFAGLWFAN